MLILSGRKVVLLHEVMCSQEYCEFCSSGGCLSSGLL